jgi:hypothetical protein
MNTRNLLKKELGKDFILEDVKKDKNRLNIYSLDWKWGVGVKLEKEYKDDNIIPAIVRCIKARFKIAIGGEDG